MQGSRQFRDFNEYHVPVEKFTTMQLANELPLAVPTDCDQYLHELLTLLESQLAKINLMALANELPDAIIRLRLATGAPCPRPECCSFRTDS